VGVRVIECVLVQDRALRAQSSIVDRHLATGDGRARVGANDRARCARAIGGAFARVDASNRARDEEMRAGGRRCGIHGERVSTVGEERGGGEQVLRIHEKDVRV